MVLWSLKVESYTGRYLPSALGASCWRWRHRTGNGYRSSLLRGVCNYSAEEAREAFSAVLALRGAGIRTEADRTGASQSSVQAGR